MDNATIKLKLLNAVTTFDRRASTKAGYNRYALGQCLSRVDEVAADIAAGTDPRQAIVRGFNGRLATACLKAIGQSALTVTEARSGRWTYSPASQNPDNP